MQGRFGRHAGGQADEDVRPPAHGAFDHQHAPRPLLVQPAGAVQDFVGEALLVEVHHQARQPLQDVGVLSAVVAEEGGAGRPGGQETLQAFFAGVDAACHAGQVGAAAQGLPVAAGGGEEGQGEFLPDCRK